MPSFCAMLVVDMRVTRFQAVCLLTFALAFAVGAGSRVSVPGLIATESRGQRRRQRRLQRQDRGLPVAGPGQMSRAAWADVNKQLGWKENYDAQVMNGPVNEQYTDAYVNQVIPKYLAHYGIPDSVPARLVAYKYGIGRIRTFHREYQAGWERACLNRLGHQWRTYQEASDEQ